MTRMTRMMMTTMMMMFKLIMKETGCFTDLICATSEKIMKEKLACILPFLRKIHGQCNFTPNGFHGTMHSLFTNEIVVR